MQFMHGTTISYALIRYVVFAWGKAKLKLDTKKQGAISRALLQVTLLT